MIENSLDHVYTPLPDVAVGYVRIAFLKLKVLKTFLVTEKPVVKARRRASSRKYLIR